MLDSIKMGMLRLNVKNTDKPYGYLRVTLKSGDIKSYFRIPVHAVFDLVGYNSYKEKIKEENPEFKTWIQNINLNIPPDSEKNKKYSLDSGHEWFLGNLRNLVLKYPNFPKGLANYIQESVQLYIQTKKKCSQEEQVTEYDDEERIVTEADIILAERTLKLYGRLQRSRFDFGRSGKAGEFCMPPFVRSKGDKNAKEVIEMVTEIVADYILNNPSVSKYSETEGIGLKLKLTSLFMECFYKEQILFMKRKLEEDAQKAKSK